MSKSSWDSEVNKDIMSYLFVEFISNLVGTKLSWNKMDKKEKNKIRKFQKKFKWLEENE